MAQITIDTGNAGMTTRIIEAMAGTFGYKDTVPNTVPPFEPPTLPNPQNKSQFAKQQVIKFMKGIVVQWETQQSAEAARVLARDKAETEIVIT